MTTAMTTAGVYLPVPQSFDEAMRNAKVLANSDLVPKDYRGKPENCLVAMQWGADIGLHGLQALQNIAVINGRPSVWGDAAKALVFASPECEDVIETIEGEGEAMVATCVAKRKGKSDVVETFSVADARRAGLWGKQGPWTTNPKRMLKLRARGFALRDQFSDVLRGLAIAEESQDLEIDITAESTEITMPQAKAESMMPKPKKTEAKVEQKPEATPEPVSDKNVSNVIDNDTGEVVGQTKKPDPVKTEAPKTSSGLAMPGLINVILAKAKAKGIDEPGIFAGNEIDTFDGLTVAKANEIIAWIQAQ